MRVKVQTETSREITELVKRFRTELAESDNTLVKIAILGRSGTGKSTFMNAIANKKLSPTGGIGEVTGLSKCGEKQKKFRPTEYRAENLCFYDLPGYGTANFPTKTFLSNFEIKKTYDCVILMTADRFMDDDRAIYESLIKQKVRCFVVRTKFDLTLEAARHDGLPNDSAKLLKLIKKNIQDNLNDSTVDVFVISSRDRAAWEFSRLRNEIEKSLEGVKREKFIENAYAATEEDLEKKRKVAEKQVRLMAFLAAAAGVVPDPTIVAGAAVDVGMLFKLGQKILRIYGLDKSQVEFHERLFGIKIGSQLANRFTVYLTKEGIVAFLKKVAGRVAAKSVSRWIPFIGQAIAAGIGYQMTFSFGEGVMKDCEEFSRKILDHSLKNERLRNSA